MPAKPNKTQQTENSVEDFLSKVEPPVRRQDAEKLCAVMQRLSGEPPKMWGPSMVGFGLQNYRYESGREGQTMKIGFAPRKPAMVLYGLGPIRNEALVAELGKVKTGKGCIYVKSLSDIDQRKLENLIALALTPQA